MATQKENLFKKFKTLPKRSISEIEKQLIFILIEKSKIQRERSLMTVNQGFLFFFAFVILAALSKINETIPESYLWILFLLGIIVLIITVISYQSTIKKEEQTLDALLDSFLT